MIYYRGASKSVHLRISVYEEVPRKYESNATDTFIVNTGASTLEVLLFYTSKTSLDISTVDGFQIKGSKSESYFST